MELLINLLILFFIFFTVFKRFQKIAKKQEEIKVPPSPPHGPATKTETITDVLKELGRRMEQGVEVDSETFKPSAEPVHPYGRRMEQGVEVDSETFKPSAEPDHPYGHRIGETQREFAEPVPVEPAEIFSDAEVYPQVEEPVPVIIEQPDYMKVNTYKKGKKQYALQFEGSEVVKGILMSEILGTPVSMRTERMNFN